MVSVLLAGSIWEFDLEGFLLSEVCVFCGRFAMGLLIRVFSIPSAHLVGTVLVKFTTGSQATYLILHIAFTGNSGPIGNTNTETFKAKVAAGHARGL